MFSKVMEQLKKLKADAGAEIGKLESALATLKAERELTARLPVPRDEFLERVEGLVEPSEKFAEQVAGMLSVLQEPRVTQPVNVLGIDARTPLVNGKVPVHLAPEAGTVSPYAVNQLLAPMIRESLRAHAESMDYPPEVGLPADQRRARLAELDRESAQLEGRIAGLRDDLAQAGVRI